MNSPRAEDAELLADWKAGDKKAGADLLARYTGRLYEFFRNKVSTGAEELVQQTFADIVAAHPGIEDDGQRRSFRALAFTIARRRLLNHFRDWRRNASRLDPLEHSVVDVDPGASQAVVADESRRRLQRAMQRLPMDAQIVIELFYWEELPVNEIAEVVEVAPGTVKSRLARARTRLRELMAEGGPLDEDTLRSMLTAASRA